MRKFLLLMIALLAGVSGAWADVLNLTPSNGTYVTSSGNYVNSISFSTSPAITVTASANNMDKRQTSTYLLWHSGSSGSSTYTISAGAGYIITAYSVTGEANSSAQTLTAGAFNHEFAVGASSSFEVTGLKSSSVSFVQTGVNASGLKITSISVTVAKVTDEQIAAYNIVQSWIPTIQVAKGLVSNASNYISNAKSTAEGTYEALLDQDYATYFHTAYGNAGPNEDHYLQATLSKSVDAIYFYYKKRSQNNNNRPTSITISGSNDGSNFTDITTINSGLPTDAAVLDYTSNKINLGASYQYLRFTVTATNNNAQSNGHVFFTFSEFYILPSDETIDDVMTLRASLIGTAALDYTEQNISDVTTANTNLLSTVVNVTYNLYEADGETFVDSRVVEQEKNSAVSVPAALMTGSYYYDYNTEGTIGVSDCAIKVTRTLKSGIVYPYMNLSNTKSYYIKTRNNARGGLSTYENAGTKYLASPVKGALGVSAKKFAILSYEGNYYLYSVEDGQFVTYSTEFNAPLADVVTGTTDRVTFIETTVPLYELRFNNSGSRIINSSSSYTYGIVMNSWGATSNQWDDGCLYSIEEAGDFDPTSALAALDEFFHPSYTVTYKVKDGNDNVLFTSDPVTAALNDHISTLPAEYQLTNFYEYNTVDVTISASGNTDVVFTATPKAEPLVKYTADTSNPYYYNLNIRSQYLVYNNEAAGQVALQASSEPFNADASWAFIGEPYAGFKVINKTKGTDYFLTYTSVVTGSNHGNNNIQFVEDGEFNNRYWIVDKNTGGFCLRMKENTNIYFHHDNGQKFLRTCSVAEWSGVHNDEGSTIVASTDEDVLIALYDSMKDYTYGTAIGQYSAEGVTAADANLTISQVGSAIDGNMTSAYAAAYAALNELQGKTTLNTPAAGFYRVKNVATNGYLYATAASSYTSTDRYVYANGNNSGAETIIQLVEHDGHLYMLNQGHEFGWIAESSTYSGQVGYVKANGFDKYVNWLPGSAAGQIAFAICYGNGTGGYASYLTQGIYAVDTNDDAVIRGIDYKADAAQWIVEAATEVSVPLNNGGDGNYYATFCAPFSYTVADGATAYTLNESGNWLIPSPIVGEVAAGTPVLLKGSLATATLTLGSESSSSIGTGTALTGTYLAKTIDGAADYVLGIDEGVVGFYHWDTSNLGANRAYVAGGADVKGFVINWGDAVGIKSVDNGQALDNASIFNLAGQRLNKVQRGVNIVNGKKVIVK